MKIMLTAIVVGMIGIFTLHHFAKVNLHIKPTKLGPNIVGGLLFGVGFALIGYCPGTAAAAVGQGSWDAFSAWPVLCAALVEHARTALRAVDDAEAAVAAARDGLAGPLRVGAIPTANAALVPRALARMEARRPDIALRFREGGSPDLAAAVGAGELDLAVVFGAVADAPAGTRTVELLRDPLLVALPRGHRLATAATVDVAELAGERWVQGAPDVADVVLELADPAPRRVFRVREWTAKQGFVAAGLGITIIAALAADGVRGDVELRPLRGAGSARRVVAVVDAAAGPAVELLLDLLREETGKLWKDRRP